MNSPRWIEKSVLLILHEESLAEFGGASGLRDEGLLESALDRPLNAFAYGRATTPSELAAAYGFGIVKNHALMDGNKRAAFLSIGLFLAINGYRLSADTGDATRVMLEVACSEMTESDLAIWIAAHIENR